MLLDTYPPHIRAAWPTETIVCPLRQPGSLRAVPSTAQTLELCLLGLTSLQNLPTESSLHTSHRISSAPFLFRELLPEFIVRFETNNALRDKTREKSRLTLRTGSAFPLHYAAQPCYGHTLPADFVRQEECFPIAQLFTHHQNL